MKLGPLAASKMQSKQAVGAPTPTAPSVLAAQQFVSAHSWVESAHRQYREPHAVAVGVIVGVTVGVGGSIWQDEEQPSPSSLLPSSQASPVSTVLSPQAAHADLGKEVLKSNRSTMLNIEFPSWRKAVLPATESERPRRGGSPFVKCAHPLQHFYSNHKA